VNQREADIQDKFDNTLSGLSAAKKKVLQDDLARELEKERLRLEFAHLASEFLRWSKDTVENVESTRFGFTLEKWKRSKQPSTPAMPPCAQMLLRKRTNTLRPGTR